MYLSNRDIQWAIASGKLVVDPPPSAFGGGYDETSIDLHLDHVREARIWDVSAYLTDQKDNGLHEPEVRIGQFNYGRFAKKYLVPPPLKSAAGESTLVFLNGNEIVIKPLGFLLWITQEIVGTPTINPELICFVDGKSTRARTGVLVHLTAPTIHAGWQGKITLEIANLGPFHLVLKENDVIAQLTVATISSASDAELKIAPSATAKQRDVTGAPPG